MYLQPAGMLRPLVTIGRDKAVNGASVSRVTLLRGYVALAADGYIDPVGGLDVEFYVLMTNLFACMNENFNDLLSIMLQYNSF